MEKYRLAQFAILLRIEINGTYHHSEIHGGKDKTYHLKKLEACLLQNIKLLQFWDIEWNQKQDLVKSMIQSQLGINITKQFARKCECKYIEDISEISSFLNSNHIQGYTPAKYSLGLYFRDSLISILTLAKPRFTKQYDWEIIRFANKQGMSIPGAFSKLLSRFEKDHPNSTIISYCDRRLFTGSVYTTSGFTLTHISFPSYYYLIQGKYSELVSREKYQKHKLSKLLPNFDPNLTEWENMQLAGNDRIWDCGTLVFIKTLNSSMGI